MIAVWAAASPFLPATIGALDHEDVPYVVLPAEPDSASLAIALDADALIVGGALVTAEFLASFRRLRLVVRGGVGVDRIDMAAATEQGMMVTNVVDYGRNEVADHTLLLMLAAVRRLGHFVAQNHINWRSISYVPVVRLQGRRLGIVGLGRIGSAVAERARAFGMDVVAYDPLVRADSFTRAGVAATSFYDLLATSDVISLHAPFTPDSHHILNRAAFDRMRRTPVIVNTARGGLIDTSALVEALDSGAVGAAGLDVLEDEPGITSHASLLGRDNVVVTPHIAWYSQGSQEQLGRTAAELALDFVKRGIRPRLLNPQLAVRQTEVTP